MPAVKHKPKKPAKKPKAKKTPGKRYENAYCQGECRLRTKGMRVGDERRRVHGKRRYKVIRMPDAD